MTRRRDPRAPLALVVAVLLVGGGLGPSIPTAIAAPAPPSWDDVEAARGDVEATQIAIERITEQAAAQAAELETVRTAAIEAGEKLQAATDALAAAEHHLTSLERQHDAAAQGREIECVHVLLRISGPPLRHRAAGYGRRG